ncbi:MAG: hypothetical protein Q4D96_13850 [Propionibacteriaceae bacterium]|nr:hypothetical protein [Propionibacteriaceae bacterium]
MTSRTKPSPGMAPLTRRLLTLSVGHGALAGLYGSPPGGAAYGDDTLSPSKWTGIAAGIRGFLAFLAVMKLAGVKAHGMHLPELPPRS